jgi:hypothetical protein
MHLAILDYSNDIIMVNAAKIANPRVRFYIVERDVTLQFISR